MSTASDAPAAGEDASTPKPGQLMKDCGSCRLLSGGGLIVAAAYVSHAARRVMRGGGTVSVGMVAQVTFAAFLAALGGVVIMDPVGKSHRVT